MPGFLSFNGWRSELKGASHSKHCAFLQETSVAACQDWSVEALLESNLIEDVATLGHDFPIIAAHRTDRNRHVLQALSALLRRHNDLLQLRLCRQTNGQAGGSNELIKLIA